MCQRLRPKALLLTFDAFGTLFKPREPIAKQYCDVARQLGLYGFRENDVQSSFRNAFKDESKRHPNYGKATGMLPADWWANIIRATFTPLLRPPQTLPQSLIATLLTRFTSSAGYTLYPDVAPFFHHLRQQRLLLSNSTPQSPPSASNQTTRAPPPHPKTTTVGIITNSDPRVPAILADLGLAVSPLRYPHASYSPPSSPSPSPSLTSHEPSTAHDIAFTVLSYDVGIEKPDRGIFDAARELFLRSRAGADVGEGEGDGEGEVEMVHVGDDLEKDGLGARRAGWGSVLIDREGRFVGDGRVEEGGAGEDGEGRVRKISALGELMGVLGLRG